MAEEYHSRIPASLNISQPYSARLVHQADLGLSSPGEAAQSSSMPQSPYQPSNPFNSSNTYNDASKQTYNQETRYAYRTTYENYDYTNDNDNYNNTNINNGNSSKNHDDNYLSTRYSHTRHNTAESLGTTTSKRSKFEDTLNQFNTYSCPSKGQFHHGVCNWLTLSILIISVFSTIFSGIFLVIALVAPRWGRKISSSSGAALNASTANVLTQLFAKLIELSFVCTFVVFLGQVLSRRAFSRQSRGISIAEFCMRGWIMQPGTIITHFESVRYAGLTVLGMVSLFVMILAALYSTAASALVSPTLKLGAVQDTTLFGLVKTPFANITYLSNTCQTPIKVNPQDNDYSNANVGSTCLTIETAAQGFNNYQQFMTNWAAISNGLGSGRAKGVALYLQNTTVNGSWIYPMDIAEASSKFSRIINNFTLVFPHAGIFRAARDSRNNILQPEDLDGVGTYIIQASIPSPYVNTVCANIKKDDIKDIVYQTAVTDVLSPVDDLPSVFAGNFSSKLSTLKTPIDKIFGWDQENVAPVFYKYPIPFNTVIGQPWYNATYVSKPSSLYLLGNGGNQAKTTKNNEYLLCKITVGNTPLCSTKYTATGTGGTMNSICSSPPDEFAYINKVNRSSADTITSSWPGVGNLAFDAMALNNGVIDGQASNARLLMGLMLQSPVLDPLLPSPAEAIAVLAGSTLLDSSIDAPFVEYWNYTDPSPLKPGVYQSFKATIQAQQYASGGAAQYQRAFTAVLIAVFLVNIWALLYLLVHCGLVTDFTEPPVLFALALNSPPSHLLAGACGAGPLGPQMLAKWGVAMEDEHLFLAARGSVAAAAAANAQSPAAASGFASAAGPSPAIGARHESYHSWGELFRFRGRKQWAPLPGSQGGDDGARADVYGKSSGAGDLEMHSGAEYSGVRRNSDENEIPRVRMSAQGAAMGMESGSGATNSSMTLPISDRGSKRENDFDKLASKTSVL